MSFSADSIEGFLITGSMVGLSLVLAIYTLTLPRIKDMLQRRARKLKELIKRRDELLQSMQKDKEDTMLTEKYWAVKLEGDYIRPFGSWKTEGVRILGM